MKIIVFFVLAYLPFSSHAQIKISGFVRSQEDRRPISHATILLNDFSDTTRPLVAFSFSDDQGFYTLSLPDAHRSYMITVRAGAYKETVRPVSFNGDSLEIKRDFYLVSSVSYLDTVKIDMKFTISITGDTLTFNPDAYARKNETTIEDLLKNIPGMDVKDDGKITFNGAPVSNVLIEGDDLFKRNYQQLTQNAAPKIIDKIDVIKNYQKDKLLKEFNQGGTQVINLRLKDEYRHYIFGNGSAGIGNAHNKLADVFLIKLSPRTKLQAGANYNTIGNIYTSAGRLSLDDYLDMNEKSFFSYNPIMPIMNTPRFYFQNIPLYYQQKNSSVQAYGNALFKNKKWEHSVNMKFAGDTLHTGQQFITRYPDGTVISENNTGSERIQQHEYNYSAARALENTSFYLNASLTNRHRKSLLQTVSDHSLNSLQQLASQNLSWQMNMSYIRKLSANVLWTNTLGYFDQKLGESLNTNPDFLFWLFPNELALYQLKSDGDIRFRYAKYRSSFVVESNRMSHQLDAGITADVRQIANSLNVFRLGDDSTGTPFLNDTRYRERLLSLGYTGKLRLARGRTLSLKLSNEPVLVKFGDVGHLSTKTAFLHDYALGLSAKLRGLSWSINTGFKRQLTTGHLLYTDFVQDGFHALRSGFGQPFTTQSLYSQMTLNSFSVRRQMISFLMLNLSRNHDEYIRSMKTTGISTVTTYPYHPNNTNSLILFFRTQKSFGSLPFSIHPNLFFNWRTILYEFDDRLRKSDIRSLNATLGVKTYFKSIINFNYDFSVLYASNHVKLPAKNTSNTSSLVHKGNIFLVMPKVVNTTLTYYHISNNNGIAGSDFLDILVNRKAFKQKVMFECGLRNILDNRKVGTQTISPFSVKDNLLEVRGREFYLKLRYELR